jgi:hypothetical protein
MKYFFIAIQFFILNSVYSQTKDCSNCWKITDSVSKEYFKLLFSNSSESIKSLALIKLEFEESDMFYVTEFKNVSEFCRWKYNLDDSSVENFTEKFIMSNSKLILKDTLFLSTDDNRFKGRFFNSSILRNYNDLGLKNFLIKYCEGGKIKDYGVPLPIIAYLYEERIFWENITFNISAFALRQIEKTCKVKWDYRKKRWIDLTNSKIL